MKAMVLSRKERYERFAPDIPIVRETELVFCDRGGTEEDWLAAAGDAEVMIVTPVTRISGSLISCMPNLRLIQCEGVGFDRIDLETARKQGVYVCNNAGCNARPVAEQTVMMMTMLLHRTLWGDRMVKSGRHGQAVKELEMDVPPDLCMSTVGLVGFGAIGQETAMRLRPNGTRVFYTARHRHPPETEERCGVTYLPLEELVPACDIISLHLPATAESRHLVDRDFLARMKPGAFLVNTARGAIIDDEALCEAIRSGHLAGAALDCYDPEPAAADHPVVRLAAEFPERLVLLPHQSGITQTSFRNVYRMLFANLERLAAGEKPERIVNKM